MGVGTVAASSYSRRNDIAPPAHQGRDEVDMNPIEKNDPEVWQAIAGERRRQQPGWR